MTSQSRASACFLAVAFAGALAVGALYAQSPFKKPAPPNVGAGRVAWFDITTSNLEAAKAFYGGLFGWTFAAVEGAGDLAVEIVSRDQPIGTIRTASGAIAQFNGVVYVQVDDITAACKKAVELGGTIAPGFPFNLSERPGAIALLADPSGHPIGLYSRTPLPAKK